MMIIVFSSTLFQLCLLFLHGIQFGVEATKSNAYQNEIIIDGQQCILVVEQDQEPIDAVYGFLKEHNLSQSHRSILMNDICKKLHCNRTKAKIWSTAVNEKNSYVGTFELYEGIEPVDAANDFVLQHNLTLGYRHAILGKACRETNCTRVNPIIWEKDINVGKDVVKITLLEGEEVADKIFQTMMPYKVSFQDREQIMAVARNEGVQYHREKALLFSKEIVIEEDNFNQTLVIFDDGREPVDAVNEFIETHGIDHMFEQLSQKLLSQICKIVMCTRSVPVVWYHAVRTSNVKTPIGYIEVMKNEEPVDAVDRFVATHSLTGDEVFNLVKFVCEKLTCKRDRPVVFRKRINDENGKIIGDVEIFDGEEVIDAVVRFIRNHRINLDEIALKNHFFGIACDNHRVKCTRNIGHVFENSISDEDGNILGHLIITEQEEPADKVFQFCEEKKIGVHYKNIMDQVCSNNLVLCERRMPLVASIPLRDPDGNLIGNFEVEMNDEPVDALHRFFTIHGLFQKEWDFQGVLSQLCNLQEITCNRNIAMKFQAKSILMGEKDIGPLVIWDKEEVIDVLYKKRIELNLTIADQMATFSYICSRQEVYCERTQAKIYELTSITKRDYEKFGNETCNRKYAGWQFVESFVTSSLDSKARDFMKLESVEESIGKPLFSPLLLIFMMLIVHLILMHPSIQGKVHYGHKLVVYSTVFVLLSLSQAIFIEPKADIDQAMHIHEGRLPDIIILENQEPVDIILKWGRLASKDHHPILREPIYWDMLTKVCSEIKHVKCRRLRAWEYIDMGSITVSGQSYKIDYYNPAVEPLGKKLCGKDQKVNICIEKAAKSICSRIFPQSLQCLSDLIDHMTSQLMEYDSSRLQNKDTYVKLGLEMDAPDSELFPQMIALARSNGMNVVPLNVVGNTSFPVNYEWDDKTKAAYAAMDAYHKVRDPENREWNDKPCTPYFGGSLCAKNDKDGNMIIEM